MFDANFLITGTSGRFAPLVLVPGGCVQFFLFFFKTSLTYVSVLKPFQCCHVPKRQECQSTVPFHRCDQEQKCPCTCSQNIIKVGKLLNTIPHLGSPLVCALLQMQEVRRVVRTPKMKAERMAGMTQVRSVDG